MKRALIFILIAAMLFAACGCKYKGYSGDNVDLYTVAINSVFWNKGYTYETERVRDPYIEILDTDEYGRTLFTYYEKYYVDGTLSFSALIVSQHTSQGYVYYYEDENYLLKQQSAWYLIDKPDNFSSSEIEQLKSANDWEKELNLDKCIKKQISDQKQNFPIDSDILKERIVSGFDLDVEQCIIFTDYLTDDDEGKYLFYGVTWQLNSERKHLADIFFAILIEYRDEQIVSTHSFVPSDPFAYQTELTRFKQENGWHTASK